MTVCSVRLLKQDYPPPPPPFGGGGGCTCLKLHLICIVSSVMLKLMHHSDLVHLVYSFTINLQRICVDIKSQEYKLLGADKC